MKVEGKISTFGGPDDKGVSPSEGLALLNLSDVIVPQFRPLFLPKQPAGTCGLARRLNPNAFYLAMRWDYAQTPRAFLRKIKVTCIANGIQVEAQPVDWGPHMRTGRVADLSPGLARALKLQTDDRATFIVPDFR